MEPGEVYNKFGRFKGLGGAYEEFAQFGGQSDLDPEREVKKFSVHRKPVDPEEAKRQLQADIEDFKMNRHKIGTSAIPTLACDQSSVVPGETITATQCEPQEGQKAQTEGDKLEMMNKLEEQAQEKGQLEKSPQKAAPVKLNSVRAQKKKPSFRLGRSSRLQNLNSRLNNATRFQRSSSYAKFTPQKMKTMADFMKSNSYYVPF